MNPCLGAYKSEIVIYNTGFSCGKKHFRSLVCGDIELEIISKLVFPYTVPGKLTLQITLKSVFQ
jgi:hypothetical protein